MITVYRRASNNGGYAHFVYVDREVVFVSAEWIARQKEAVRVLDHPEAAS